MEDLKEDEDREFKSVGDGYYFSSTVHYPNNKSLVKQKVYVDKNGKITKVEVVDKSDSVQILMNFNKQEFNKKFDQNYFELSSILKMNAKPKDNSTSVDNRNKKAESSSENNTTTNNNNTNSNTNNNTDNNTNTSTNNNQKNSQTNNSETTPNNSNSNNATSNNTTNSTDTTTENKNSTTNENKNQSNEKSSTTANINDIVYPMYLPNNTYLTSQDTVDTKNGKRLILTFGGDSSFVLVEETAGYEEEGLIIPVSGDFDFLSDVIGVIGNKSLSWHSNGIDYYMTSDTLEVAELVEIARSVSVLPVSK